jgi:hypothetical protein
MLLPAVIIIHSVSSSGRSEAVECSVRRAVPDDKAISA